MTIRHNYLFFICLAVISLLLAACAGNDNSKPEAPAAASIKDGRPVSAIRVSAVEVEEAYLRKANAPPKTEGSFGDCVKAISSRVKTKEANRQCRLRDKGLRQQALVTLIQQGWILNEVSERGVKLSARQERLLARQPKSIRSQLRNNYLFFNLSQNISVPPPGRKELKRIYKTTQTIQFIPPERKAILFVSTNQPNIEAAYRLLKKGESPKKIVARFNFDQETEESNGVRVFSPPKTKVGADIAPPPDSLQSFVLSLPVNKDTPPQLIDGRYILARVIDETKPRKRSFSEALPLARDIAMQKRRSQIIQERLTRKWRPRTTCNAGWVISPLCGNFTASR